MGDPVELELLISTGVTVRTNDDAGITLSPPGHRFPSCKTLHLVAKYFEDDALTRDHYDPNRTNRERNSRYEASNGDQTTRGDTTKAIWLYWTHRSIHYRIYSWYVNGVFPPGIDETYPFFPCFLREIH